MSEELEKRIKLLDDTERKSKSPAKLTKKARAVKFAGRSFDALKKGVNKAKNSSLIKKIEEKKIEALDDKIETAQELYSEQLENVQGIVDTAIESGRTKKGFNQEFKSSYSELIELGISLIELEEKKRLKVEKQTKKFKLSNISISKIRANLKKKKSEPTVDMTYRDALNDLRAAIKSKNQTSADKIFSMLENPMEMTDQNKINESIEEKSKEVLVEKKDEEPVVVEKPAAVVDAESITKVPTEYNSPFANMAVKKVEEKEAEEKKDDKIISIEEAKNRGREEAEKIDIDSIIGSYSSEKQTDKSAEKVPIENNSPFANMAVKKVEETVEKKEPLSIFSNTAKELSTNKENEKPNTIIDKLDKEEIKSATQEIIKQISKEKEPEKSLSEMTDEELDKEISKILEEKKKRKEAEEKKKREELDKENRPEFERLIPFMRDEPLLTPKQEAEAAEIQRKKAEEIEAAKRQKELEDLRKELAEANKLKEEAEELSRVAAERQRIALENASVLTEKINAVEGLNESNGKSK